MKKILVSSVLAAAIVVGGVSAYAVQKERGGRFNNSFGLSEEQKQIFTGKIKTDLDEMLAAEQISQEQYDKINSAIEKGENPAMNGRFGKGKNDNKKIPEMSEEKKTEMQEIHKNKLKEKFDNGEITEEEYNNLLEKIEDGKFGFGMRGQRPEMTEEEKAEFESKMKEKMPEFKNGEKGERPFSGNMGGRRMKKTEE